MGLKVETLSLWNFRSFAEKTISFDEKMTIIAGPNAVGKTNTVEALQLLTAGSSFRKPTAQELLHEGAEAGRADLSLRGDGREVDAALTLKEGKRRFFWCGKPCHAHDLSGNLMSVLFTPDDLSLVKRSASFRRDELDAFGAQVNRGYAKVLRTYTRGIEQRNRLLKEPSFDMGLLDAWDASVALGAATLLVHRLALFRRLSVAAHDIYGQIAQEDLSCAYRSSLGPLPEDATREDLVLLMSDALAKGRELDLRRQMSCVGPHRDDIAFALDGRDARSFASQGQQRTIVLAWKMAEVEVSRRILGASPLLLLDDVMSELDEGRRRALTSFMQEEMQTVITTTNLGYFPDELLERAKVVEIGERG